MQYILSLYFINIILFLNWKKRVNVCFYDFPHLLGLLPLPKVSCMKELWNENEISMHVNEISMHENENFAHGWKYHAKDCVQPNYQWTVLWRKNHARGEISIFMCAMEISFSCMKFHATIFSCMKLVTFETGICRKWTYYYSVYKNVCVLADRHWADRSILTTDLQDHLAWPFK